MNSRCLQGLLAITLTVGFAVNLTGASKGPDAGGYTATDQAVFSYLDISGPGGGTAVLTGTDDGTVFLTLPFTFQFYGSLYSSVCVSSNGAVYFTADAPTCTAITDFANGDISSATTPSDLPAILPFWTDLTFATPGAGAVYYQGFGTPGNRRFVIQWANAYAATSTSPVNFQLILAEGTNSITVQYQTVALGGGDPANNGGASTVGIYDTGGVTSNKQIEWSYDVPVLSNGYALVFQTSAAPAAPVLTSPLNATTNVATSTSLSWNTAAGATSYDVYLGTTKPPALITNTTGTSYSPALLANATTYYWQIVARNTSGSTPSALYSFSTVGAATPTITWSNPAGVSYGTALSATQLNATANVAGAFVYNPASGTVLGVGTQTLSVTFTPSVPGYGIGTATATIVVSPLTPVITWANPAAIAGGSALSATQLNAAANVAGSFVYNPAAGTVLSAGTQTLSVTFTPSVTGYSTATATVSLVVNPSPQTPLITWANPAAVSYGTALGATQFNATANVAGAFVYSPASGIVLSVGTQTLSVTFTPSVSGYTAATATAIIVVNALNPVITWASPASVSAGTVLSSTQLNATANVAGSFVYTPAAGAILSAGNQTLSVTFTPSVTGYSTATASVTIGVTSSGGPQTPVLTWVTPAPIGYGTALSSTQLNASSNVAGSLTYSPAAGTVLNAGMQTLSVTFTPSVSGYSSVSASVTIVVNPYPQTITFPAIPNHTTDDSLFNLSATSSAGLPVVFSVVSGAATVSATTVSITGPGPVVVEADQPGSGNIGAATPARQTFQVNLGSVKIGAVLNAASYANSPLAADGYAVVFGTAFATQPSQAGAPPLPSTLGGASITITDSTNTTLPGLLYYVSFTQINFVMPEGLASGPATVTITNSVGKAATYTVAIAALAPALFTSNASGKGSAAAFYIVVPPNGGAVQVVAASSCSGTPVVCAPTPIDLGPAGTQVYLSLYGTGIRGVSGLSGVSVTAGTVPLHVTYAGAQPTYPGLDQINALMDRSLTGKGQINLGITLDGIAANTVGIAVK